MQTEPQPILCKAAVAYKAKQPLTIEQIWVAPPKEYQIRIRVISNALCHTDVYRLDGCDPEGQFPCILGHEATGVVQSIGKGVTRVKIGDIVIPCYTPQCMERSCLDCMHKKSNLCPKIRATQGKGLMPDGTSRFKNQKGDTIFHFMGCSTFSEYTVIAEISAAKINPSSDLNKVCMIGCGVSTGWGAVMNNTNMEAGKTVAVWGLGAVGLSVIQAAKIRGASKIYAIDINQKKFQAAMKFGATHCYKPTQQKGGKAYLLECEKWGIHYTYDCTGNVAIMREALQASHRGCGQSCVIGVAQAGKQISTRSFQLVTGRKWLGTAFGGWKSVQDVPKLVNKAALGEWPIEDYVTHQFKGIEQVNQSIDALHSGDCLRAVVKISQPPVVPKVNIKVINSVKHEGGSLKTVAHWSQTTQTMMTFMIFIPDVEVNQQRHDPYPAVYFLSGLSCNWQNAPIKSGFGRWASKHKLAVVFPDTSPRNTLIPNVAADWQFGQSAGYYVDATHQTYSKHFKMYSYITKELPDLVAQYFPVSRTQISVTGFSMGGHGALITALKTGQYRSVSAFAPMANPTQSENWGRKAFRHFFKSQDQGRSYDASQLISSGQYHPTPMLIEIGSADQFADKILYSNLIQQLDAKLYNYRSHIRPGYNHSFFYVATFLEQHFQFHASYLRKPL